VLSERIDQVAATILEHSPRLEGDGRCVALATYRLLAAGRPVEVAQISARTGMGGSRVEALLGSWPGVFRDDAGRIVGFWGLSIQDIGPHRMHLDGAQLSAWCAWDTLFMPELLARPVDVRSRSPLDDDPVALRVGPERVEHHSPSALVVSMLPARESEDSIRTFCHQIHFFASEAEGERWIAARDGVFLMPLADAFELGRRVNHARFGSALTSAG
jgi:alkylmercury lyase